MGAVAVLQLVGWGSLLLFVAPRLSGRGPTVLGELPAPVTLSRLSACPVGEDVLLSAYVHDP